MVHFMLNYDYILSSPFVYYLPAFSDSRLIVESS